VVYCDHRRTGKVKAACGANEFARRKVQVLRMPFGEKAVLLRRMQNVCLCRSAWHRLCSECGEYPCDDLKKFQTAMPHRIELWDNLERIKSAGYQQWLKEIRKKLYLFAVSNHQFHL